jgi:hypothetical protein
VCGDEDDLLPAHHAWVGCCKGVCKDTEPCSMQHPPTVGPWTQLLGCKSAAVDNVLTIVASLKAHHAWVGCRKGVQPAAAQQAPGRTALAASLQQQQQQQQRQQQQPWQEHDSTPTAHHPVVFASPTNSFRCEFSLYLCVCPLLAASCPTALHATSSCTDLTAVCRTATPLHTPYSILHKALTGRLIHCTRF